jgi:phosphoglucosamine mutase
MENNLFGTDGIRTTVGIGPLTYIDIPHLGYAIACWATKKYGSPLRIVLAHDSRNSGEWMCASLMSGLMLKPITVEYARILPTPAVCNLLQQRIELDLGIVISASHNAYQDNGIKIIDRTTGKISQEDEETISSLYHQQLLPSYHTFGALRWYEDAAQDYIQDLQSMFPIDLLAHKKVLIDCAHGATSLVAPILFRALGAEVIAINQSPNGTNINDQCGALHVNRLQTIMLKEQADIGFAFDGDGDRVMAITKQGTVKNGDDMLALLTNHPTYQQEKTIVGTIMSNHALDLFLRIQKKQLVRTPVGDKYIADYLQQHNILLGGEQSGHIILNDYLPTADSIVTALRIMEIITQTDNWDLDTFIHYPQVLVNVPIGQKKSLQAPSIAAIIADYETQLHTGRLVVRYSGTENLLRVMVEDQEQQTAQRISSALALTLQKELP